MPRREKPIPRSQRISFNRGTKISRNSPAVKDDVKNLILAGENNTDVSSQNSNINTDTDLEKSILDQISNN